MADIRGNDPEILRKAAARTFNPALLVRDYGDVEAEGAACRKKAALFDFSFISVARVSGAGALGAIARLTDRDLDGLAEGRIRYALARGPDGCLRSDLTIWKETANSYQVMSGLGQDMLELSTSVGFEGCDVAVYSLQGPQSLSALDGLADTPSLAALPYFGFTRLHVAGVDCHVGRLGYTGERGFEIVLPAGDGDRLWQALAARVQPAGFTAADCLRIEAGFVLFANEFRLPVTEAEAGLVAFAGTDPAPPRYRLACFRADNPEAPVFGHSPEDITPPEPGTITVTSACHSAAAGGILGLGYVPIDEAGIGKAFADPCGRFKNVRTVQRPFYDTEKSRPRGAWI